jgi:hypothetical protein
MRISASDLLLYETSPEIHKVVEILARVAVNFSEHHNKNILREDLIRFLAQYDRMRTDQVELLKEQLLDALQWSVKPILHTTLSGSTLRD